MIMINMREMMMVNIIEMNIRKVMMTNMLMVFATCSKALLPTESNTTGVKQGSEVFPPSWSVKTLQPTRFCHPDQNKLEG